MSHKLIGLVPAVLFALAACNQSTTESTADADSLAMMADTTTAQDVYGDDESGEAGADTTLLTEIKSAFKGPQLNAKTAFVYRRAGLPVYNSLNDAGDESKTAGTIAYGSKITLVENLVNNQPSDKTTVEGFLGRYIAFKADDGSEKYIFSGYLTNFPVPKSSDGLVDYFGNNFHLVSTPVKTTSKVLFDNTTPEWWKTNYKLESDITIDDNGYYEGASTSITLPASCTMQEGFLLLKSFNEMSAYDSAFYNFPAKGFTRKIDEFRNANTESNEDGLIKIFMEDNSGCSEETFVEKVDGRVVIGSGGGC